MTRELFIWCLSAMVLFWFVGAFKRLKRIRVGLARDIHSIGLILGQKISYVRTSPNFPDLPTAHTRPVDKKSLGYFEQAWYLMAEACQSLIDQNKKVENKYLDSAAVASLICARKDFIKAWGDLRCIPQGPEGPGLPEILLLQWDGLDMQEEVYMVKFNTQADFYNSIIRKWPVSWLASVMGYDLIPLFQFK